MKVPPSAPPPPPVLQLSHTTTQVLQPNPDEPRVEAMLALQRAGTGVYEVHTCVCRGVRRLLQQGPTCGPLALNLALSLAGAADADEAGVERLVELACAAGDSCGGEMFSCSGLLRLARAAAPHLSFTLRRGDLRSDQTLADLLAGAALLVPYDSDHNWSPCLKRGHKAHWALISGVVLLKEPTGSGSPLEDPDNVYVLANHGKSLHLAAWRLVDLADSNNNLYEFPPQREGDSRSYVVPEGGVAGENGLRGYYILMQGF